MTISGWRLAKVTHVNMLGAAYAKGEVFALAVGKKPRKGNLVALRHADNSASVGRYEGIKADGVALYSFIQKNTCSVARNEIREILVVKKFERMWTKDKVPGANCDSRLFFEGVGQKEARQRKRGRKAA